MASQLLPEESLGSDQLLSSANGRFTLVYQGDDGNLVLYGPSGTLWASDTHGRPAGICVMQGDGNLVIYGPEPDREYIWDTATDGNPGSRLILLDNGNVVLYRPDNTII